MEETKSAIDRNIEMIHSLRVEADQKLHVDLATNANLEEAKKEIAPLEVLKRISDQETSGLPSEPSLRV